jgi:hypothetical protein
VALLGWHEAQAAGLGDLGGFTKFVKKVGDKLGLSPKQTMVAALFFAPHVSFDLYKRDMKAQDKAHAAKIEAEELQRRIEEQTATEAEWKAWADMVKFTRTTLERNAQSAVTWGRFAEERLGLDTSEYVEVIDLAVEGREVEDVPTLIEYVDRSNAIMEQLRADVEAAAKERR